MWIFSYMQCKALSYISRKGFVQLLFFFTSSHKYAFSSNICLPLFGMRAVMGVHACEHVVAMCLLSCCLETESSTEREVHNLVQTSCPEKVLSLQWECTAQPTDELQVFKDIPKFLWSFWRFKLKSSCLMLVYQLILTTKPSLNP